MAPAAHPFTRGKGRWATAKRTPAPQRTELLHQTAPARRQGVRACGLQDRGWWLARCREVQLGAVARNVRARLLSRGACGGARGSARARQTCCLHRVHCSCAPGCAHSHSPHTLWLVVCSLFLCTWLFTSSPKRGSANGTSSGSTMGIAPSSRTEARALRFETGSRPAAFA